MSDAATTRLVILGLDGATMDVAGPMMERGELPVLARVARDGASGTLRSSPVPVSPCAWTSITTGVNPARHGIFDFCRREPGSYRIGVVSDRAVRAKRLWHHVGDAGLASLVTNVPATYPPRPLRGGLVAGLLTPSLKARFTEPETLAAELLEAVPDYRVSTDVVFDPTRPVQYAAGVAAVFEARERAIRFLHERHAAAFEMHVAMLLDHGQHKLWRDPRELFAPDAAASPFVHDLYRRADAFVGRMLDLYGPDTTVLILSDHGFGPLDGVLRTNRWLVREGFLTLKASWTLAAKKWLARTDLATRTFRLMQRVGLGGVGRLVPKGVQHAVATSGISFDDVDWSRTRAYAYGEFGQLFVNLKGREPEGTVEPGAEYEALLADLGERLGRLRDPASGEPLVPEVRRKDELYAGPLLGEAPDLTFAIGGNRYDASVAFGFEQEDVLGGPEFHDSGSHRAEGILLALGPTVRAGHRIEGAGVHDVTPTALHLMGLPVPDDLDGRVLAEMMSDARPVVSAGAGGAASAPAEPTEEDMSAVEERLRSLGYMD